MPKPQTIGKYRIERILGRGGMGTVYVATDPVIHRKVALKTMMQHLSNNLELRARFFREAQAAGGLRHRNIVTVYDLGEDHGQPYIAMEFIEGRDLEKIIQNKDDVSIEWKLDVLRQVCEGLAAAHRAGVIHRDVKPANIRVTAEGEVKIMDFGIAHLQTSSAMTAGGLVVGTLLYMAPEMVDNKRKPDRRADVFSVGAIAYEMLAGRKPFEADSLSAVMYKITHERPDPRLLVKSRYSPGLERVVMKALQRDLDARYQSLDDMRNDLVALQTDSNALLVARAEPEQAAQLVEKGRRLMSGGDAASALECAKDALSLNPDDAGALALARAAAPLSPDDAPESNVLENKNVLDELTTELEHARREGQLQKALSLCRRILEINPNEEVVRLAAVEIDKEIKSKEVEQLLAMAVSYAREGEFDLSAKIATKVEKLDPSNSKLHDLKQYLLEESGRRTADALVATAQEHLALGNLAEAVAAAEEALGSNPHNAVAREIRDGATRLLTVRQPVAPPPAPQPPPEVVPSKPVVPPMKAASMTPKPMPAKPSAAPPKAVPPPAPTPVPVVKVAPPAPAKPVAPPAPPPKPAPPVASVVSAPPPPPTPPPAPPRPMAPPAAPEARVAKAPEAAPASVATPPPATGAPSTAELASLLDAALNHFLMNEPKKAKKAVEKVLAIDPNNKKAKDLLKMLG